MSEPLVVFDGVVKRYGSVTAVKHLDLTIDKGEFVALMGPSGCGKTTSLRMLAGLEDPSAGDIRIGGRSMKDIPAHERDTPLVWQSLALFPFLNVRENVEFGLKMRGVDKTERKRRALEWLDRMGMKDFGDRRIDQLSGGQKQRVALARSLVTEPEMLLLDEPLSALDAHLVIRMQGVLTKLQRELGITFVYVTHSQSEAFAMADRVVIMGEGEIAQIGTPHEVYRAPATRFVAEFVGRNNIFKHVDGSEYSVAADRVTVTTEKSNDNAVACNFISEEFAGTSIVLYLETPDGDEIKASVDEDTLTALSPEPGATLWASWSPEAEHALGT